MSSSEQGSRRLTVNLPADSHRRLLADAKAERRTLGAQVATYIDLASATRSKR